MLAGLTPPSAGTVSINGQIFAADRTTPPRAGRRTIQYVFQDPNGSLNPRKTVRNTSRRRSFAWRGSIADGATSAFLN
jgi:ABC-type dipeptide/oligopeptide/nickel transport system ATPase subunit